MAPITTPSYDAGSRNPLTVGLLESVHSLWAKCAKHAARVSKKLTSTNSRNNSPRSPLHVRSKKLFATISNKAINFRHNKKKKAEAEEEEYEADDGFGEGGLWQRAILMGDKCKPLDFSGVIYYDSKGTPLSELPMRSPRASPLPRYAYTAAVKQEQ